MKEYKINGVVTVGCWTTVKAKSKEEAIEIAERRDMAGFQIDGGYSIDEYFHLSNDGMAKNLSIEEEV